MVLINPESLVLQVSEQSQAGEARRRAMALAMEHGLSEAAASNLAIVVTELATNLLYHGSGGEIILTRLDDPAQPSIDVTALDRGPGMVDVARSLRDGYSTAGTSGTGLGAASRLSQEFDIYSEPGKGTAVFARFYRDAQAPVAGVQFGALRVPLQGEYECGDAWSITAANGHIAFLIADGLGHGPLAATASKAAVRVLRESDSDAPADLLRDMHAALRSTRGAAAGLASVDPVSGEVRFCGVGNTVFVLAGDGRPRHMISHNGTLGHHASHFQEFSYRWNPDEVLVMHSDGLSANWAGNHYPGLMQRHPGLIAAVLFRDFRRTRDDATVVVARIARSS